jgi:D-alanyl-D-alanine carboxypeptidase
MGTKMSGMKKRNKILAKLLTAVVLTTTSVYLFAPWQFALYYLTPLPETVEAQVNEAADQAIDGIILYVQKDGEAPTLYAGGWHDRALIIPAKPEALFKIGSIRKLYDAAALAKLVVRGGLSLDGTLADYMPELVGRIQYAGQITLKMMVQHKSGIPNLTDQAEFDWGRSWSGEEALALVLDKPADFAPGSDTSYSNTNYLLLRRIMSKVLGYDHSAFIGAEILAPLGLKRTFFSVEDAGEGELMSGYHVGYEQDFKALDQGFVASAEDVGIFLRALNDGTLFTDAEQQLYDGLYELGHDGWVLGYSSRAHYFADIDTVVIQFVNTTGDDTLMLTGIIYNRVLELLRQKNQ